MKNDKLTNQQKRVRSRVTRGGNFSAHINDSSGIQTGVIVQPPVARPERLFYGYLRCKWCDFETNTPENLVRHLRKGH